MTNEGLQRFYTIVGWYLALSVVVLNLCDFNKVMYLFPIFISIILFVAHALAIVVAKKSKEDEIIKKWRIKWNTIFVICYVLFSIFLVLCYLFK